MLFALFPAGLLLQTANSCTSLRYTRTRDLIRTRASYSGIPRPLATLLDVHTCMLPNSASLHGYSATVLLCGPATVLWHAHRRLNGATCPVRRSLAPTLRCLNTQVRICTRKLCTCRLQSCSVSALAVGASVAARTASLMELDGCCDGDAQRVTGRSTSALFNRSSDDWLQLSYRSHCSKSERP